MSARNGNDSEFRGAGVYPRELVPAVRPGDHVRLEPDGETYRIDAMTVQPGIFAFDSDSNNGVSLSANSTSEDNEAVDLEQNQDWLAQLRPVHPGLDFPDDVNVTIDMGGKQAPMYTAKTQRGEFAEETPAIVSDDGTGTSVTADEVNNHLLEFYIHEDEVPYFTFEETGGNTPTVSDVRYAGFQYRLEAVSGTQPGMHVEPVPTEKLND